MFAILHAHSGKSGMDKKSDSQWFQVSIAAAGVIVTALLGSGQWRLSRQQNEMLREQRIAEERRVKENLAAVSVKAILRQLQLGHESAGGSESTATGVLR